MWPRFDPGKAVHQITLLTQVQTQDVAGTEVNWVPVLSAYAEIEPVRGIDVLKSGQDTTQLFLTVKILWQRGVEPNMRVQAKNGTYIVQSVENPGERNVILILNCVALGLNK